MTAQERAGRLVAERATAERDHGAIAASEHVRRDGRLPAPELPLALAREEIGDAGGCEALDLAIEIDERAVQPASERPAHGRLAGAHEAGNHDRPVA
jgi:hypothetical protein